MGLDSVELVMAMEEAFGVELANDEAVVTVTPRLLTDLIFSKLERAAQETCQSQRAFYTLRKAFVEAAGTSRTDFRPDALCRRLLPSGRERDAWLAIGAAAGVRRWPKLSLSDRSRSTLMIAVIAVSCTAGWQLAPRISTDPAIYAALAVMLLLGVAVAILAKPLQTVIPHRLQSVRDLIPYAMTAGRVGWTREQVAALVKEITIEQIGISESRYHEDAHFINDLGVD